MKKRTFNIDEEILRDLVDVCNALVSCEMITTICEEKNCFSYYQSELKNARLYVETYERFMKGEKENAQSIIKKG